MRTETVTYNSKSQRLAAELRRDIRSGCFDLAGRLPSEHRLSSIYGVSRATVSKAVGAMLDEKLLERRGRILYLNGVEAQTPEEPPRNPYKIAGIFPREDAFTLGLSSGISNYATQNGLDFHLFMNPGAPGYATPEELIKCGVDGVLIIPHPHLDKYYRPFHELKLPVVMIDYPLDGYEGALVDVDNKGGAYRAVTRLIARYRRPVYCFGFGPELGGSAIPRYDGYRCAMNDAGFGHLCSSHTCLYDFVDLHQHFEWRGDNHAGDHLAKLSLPASIFSLNDYAAYSVYVAARELRLDIGRDIKIISFDDLPMAYSLSPSLSSVRQPREEAGFEAARILHKMMTGELTRPLHVTLPVTLSEKESS